MPAASAESTGLDQLMQHGATAEAALDVGFDAESFHAAAHVELADEAGIASADLSGQGLMGDSRSSGSADAIDFDGFAAPDMALHDHLRMQAAAALDGLQLALALALIDRIDPTGYLDADLLDMAHRLGVPVVQLETALAHVQRFDPPGVGARSLAECLAIQARDADRYDPAMACLIDHLDLLAKGALAQLKRICGVDDEDMADMIHELRAYDPKPGLKYGGEIAQPIIPDVFVRAEGAGWQVEMNAGTLPRLLINKSYGAQLGKANANGCKAWLSDCMANANWLVKALDQRQRTIIRVAAEIVTQQEGFFRHGVSHMRPLTLRQVADAVGLHESTVSRVTSNKYLACARGVFELKYFFSSGIQSADGGEAVSAQAVKSAIKTLIDGEDANNILSDDTLVELLKDKGFDIARRTVAKYREAMGLGSSIQRRRQKALGR